ncbi:CopD family protein [Chryseobacterium aquaticum]|uniref:Protoporphyrinogen IX oxidase n=1 Tax=Chryseobacterium aquaticum TaxID=452084 RepID=A0A848N9D4_9FLAO|nr:MULTISPECIES: CopD family protein [Chryseobacterium]NMR34013.1 CopD family protein [Chryseobacterium aquaticum]NRQ46088.1 CopD family protein [Chryseobacterium sp. C-204]
MLYIIIKALHIIFMVSYFAGIFYLVRIFVYYKDTDDFADEKKKILREQYIFMARRLWNIITVPAGVIMTVCGITMILLNLGLMKMPWFHLKLTFLVGLAFFHYWAWRKLLLIKKLNGEMLSTSNVKLRQINEIATFILFLVVFTVILKSSVIEYWWQLITGFFVLVFLIMMTVKLVNKNKKK